MRRPALIVAAGIVLATGGCSSDAPASHAAACSNLALGATRVGDTRVYRSTAADGQVSRETAVLRSEHDGTYTFRRTRTGQAPVSQVYSVHDCTVTLPTVRKRTSTGGVETISGLTVPRLSSLTTGRVVRSTATLHYQLGRRSVDLPVQESVVQRGHSRVTVPAGRFDAQIVDLTIDIRAGGRRGLETTRYWFDAHGGTVRAVSSSIVDGAHRRGTTVELLSSR